MIVTELTMTRELAKHGIDVINIKHDTSQGLYSTFLPYTVRFNYHDAECVRVGQNLELVYDRIMHDFVGPNGTMRKHTMLVDALVNRVGGYRINRDAWMFHVSYSEQRKAHTFSIARDKVQDRLVIFAKLKRGPVESVYIDDVQSAVDFMKNY